jgi:hypothetical protein
MMPDFSRYRLLPLTARSRLDPRDYRFRFARAVDVMAEIAAGVLPASVDLHARGTMPDVWDQGQEGSCTGHSEAAAMVHSYLRAGVTLAERLSPRYVYWRERVVEGSTQQDSGAEPRDGWDQLIKVGVCLESKCPYVAGDYAVAPDAAADTDAGQHLASRYEALTDWTEIALALGQDSRFVSVAGYWYQEWFDPPSNVIPLVNPAETPAGGHAYGYCGYRVEGGALQFRLHNSWSAAWADAGHAWMLAAQADQYLYERWTVYGAVESQPQPQPPKKPDPADPFWNWWPGAGDRAAAARDLSLLAEQATAIGEWLPWLQAHQSAASAGAAPLIPVGPVR